MATLELGQDELRAISSLIFQETRGKEKYLRVPELETGDTAEGVEAMGIPSYASRAVCPHFCQVLDPRAGAENGGHAPGCDIPHLEAARRKIGQYLSERGREGLQARATQGDRGAALRLARMESDARQLATRRAAQEGAGGGSIPEQ